MALPNPHGKEKKLKPLLLTGAELEEEKKKAEKLKKISITSREAGDLIMMGIGGFTPLTGFMTQADWKGVCADFKMADGTFWPIPITLSASKADADGIKIGDEIALWSDEYGKFMATMKVTEKYTIDKDFECKHIYRTTDIEHPGVKMVKEQAEVNLAGPVKVLSQGGFPTQYPGLFLTPAETRKMFEEKGWNTVAALQLRNPMHRSHEFLAKIAIEICDGVLIHQLLGKLKPGDIPAEVRVKAIDKLVELYFVKNTCIQAGYPLDMRYAGPREALLHATFRQNYGCYYMIIGRDHAGVGEYYGPFDAQKIFDEIPEGSLETKPLKIDWTFYCNKCDGMASMRTCPHGKDDRVLLSGTKLRKMLSEGQEVSSKFSRPEVAAILKEYYQGLTEKVEIKLHKYAEGEK
ncbi:MAG: sulfate adenylyltransferase [Nitrospirae bacterium]|jgi:sulfate adenylyltransferase|nr:sulfate adenylyltransferase [Nitrospirota bacterium]